MGGGGEGGRVGRRRVLVVMVGGRRRCEWVDGLYGTETAEGGGVFWVEGLRGGC